MEFTDQLNRKIFLSGIPQRIVSLVPSQTELLVDLGLMIELVGITKFCIHPAEIRSSATIIGGTKNINIEKIRLLKPDLIIANKEENELSQIETLAHEFPVWISDIRTLDDAINMIRSVAEITGKQAGGETMISEILKSFADLSANLGVLNRKKVAYLIWNEPIMTVGRDTFIHNMLHHSGYINVFENHDDSRYPVVSAEDLKNAEPELLFLSSEPFPFGDVHLQHFKSLLPHTGIFKVDGEMFSWYGSRLLKATSYFKQLFREINS